MRVIWATGLSKQGRTSRKDENILFNIIDLLALFADF